MLHIYATMMMYIKNESYIGDKTMKKQICLSVKSEINDKLNNLSKESGYTKSMIVSLLIEKLAEEKISLV